MPAALSDGAYAAVAARSEADFAAGEGQADPRGSYPLRAPPER